MKEHNNRIQMPPLQPDDMAAGEVAYSYIDESMKARQSDKPAEGYVYWRMESYCSAQLAG